MKRRDLLLASASMILPAGALAAKKAAPQASPLVTINRAGMLAMHAERIGRCWIQMGVGIDTQRAGMQLQQSTREFEQIYASLDRTVSGELILLIEQRWRVYRMAWGAKPAPDGVRRLSSLAQDLSDQAMKLAAQLAKAQPGDGSRRLLGGSEIRMLTQRMARLALTRQWGMAPPDVSLVLAQQRKTFSAQLGALVADTALPENARADIELARQQWTFFDQTLATAEDLKAATQAAGLSERMRELLDGFCTHVS
ncbi:hypothetical protein OPU71_16055 [Niveibacterium sp. 24ML]|uniref:hypothetical protein n=1 Tax=Niveibacterium sp. 24ML TaxID=2985512 RepID=UPI00226FEF34|nr:hypothetical protein [Niveibacterium sp. 24ML]MCX9157641.1 hypothetical protein [Niveibacterium sp. 24ML]